MVKMKWFNINKHSIDLIICLQNAINMFQTSLSIFRIAFFKEKEIRQKVISVCMKEVQISLSATYANMPIPTVAIFNDSEPRYYIPFPAHSDHCTSIALPVNSSMLYFSLNISVFPYKSYSPDVQTLGKAKFSGNNVPCYCPLLATRNLNLG